MSALRKAEKRFSDALDALDAAIDRARATSLSEAEMKALDAHLAAAEKTVVEALAARAAAASGEGASKDDGDGAAEH